MMMLVTTNSIRFRVRNVGQFFPAIQILFDPG